MTDTPIRISACAHEIHQASGLVQLMPAGLFRAGDGRPQGLPGWLINDDLAHALIRKIDSLKTPLVIDYEHQTLKASENGEPAPAAGWFKNVIWKSGQGLFASSVEWTVKARHLIKNREYRFISPVFSYDTRGQVISLHHAALTNTPAIDGMLSVAVMSASRKERLTRLAELSLTADQKKMCDMMGVDYCSFMQTKIASPAEPATSTSALSLTHDQKKMCDRMGVAYSDFLKMTH